MKIAHIIPWIEPTGGCHIIYHHVLALRKLGHDVDVFAAGYHPQYLDNYEFKTLDGVFSSNTDINKVAELPDIDYNSYDLLVSNGLAGAILSLDMPHPNKFWFIQNFDPWVFGENEEINRAYNGTENFFSYCSFLKTLIENKYQLNKWVSCTNGIEYYRFLPFQKRRHKMQRRIGFMTAYYGKLKGVKFANEIFGELKKRGYTTVEVNAVGGPLPNTDEYYRNPSFQKKSQLIADCDICIHPSLFETWGLAVSESMTLGTPVVCSDSIGIQSFVNANGMFTNSIIVKNRDVNEFCDAIENLYYDMELYHRIQKNGINTMSKYAWMNVADSIVDSYKNMLR